MYLLELDASKYKSVVLKQYNLKYTHNIDVLISFSWLEWVF